MMILERAFKNMSSFYFLVFVLCLNAVLFKEISAQDDLWDRLNHQHRNALSYDLMGSTDLQFMYSGTQSSSWREGGRGILKSGKSSSSLNKKSSIEVPKLSLVSILRYHKNRIYLHGVFDKNQAIPGGLVEGYYRRSFHWKRGKFIRMRTGLLIPKVSMEHDGKGWLSKYSAIPSALNTWIGEEVRPLGIEFMFRKNLKKQLRVFSTLSLFGFNDTSGVLLSWRGWALHDHLLRTGTRWRVQQVPTSISPLGQVSTPIQEIDGRPGFYTQMGLERKGHWQVHGFYYDALANPEELDSRNEYAWDTSFWVLSGKKNVKKHWTFVSQILFGSTLMGPRHIPAVDNRFQAWYVLGQYEWSRNWSVSARYEQFKVSDRDRGIDSNTSDGEAATLSITRKIKNGKVTFEWIEGNNSRVGNESYSANDVKQRLLLLNIRLFVHR